MNQEENTDLELENENEEEESGLPDDSTQTNGDKIDPLDALKDDPDQLLKEAKKYRAISQRKKDTPKEEKPEKAPESGYLTKADFFKSNEKKAVRLATTISPDDSDEIKAIKKDIADNKDDIFSLYVSRNGKETPEDIVEDIFDAHFLYRKKNPIQESSDGGAELTKSPVVKGGSAPKVEKPADTTSNDPRFQRFKSPEEWYPKKDE